MHPCPTLSQGSLDGYAPYLFSKPVFGETHEAIYQAASGTTARHSKFSENRAMGNDSFGT